MYIITTSSLETQLPKLAKTTTEREGGEEREGERENSIICS